MGNMKAGFAVVEITPPLGADKPGGFTKARNRSLHDPLHVKAMVVDDEQRRVAFVSVDALSLKASIVRSGRAFAQQLCGIPASHVMCAATHTHSGGPLVGASPTDFEHAADPEFCRALAVEHSVTPDPDYVRQVSRQIGNAVAVADMAKTPVQLAVGVGRETGVSFNRRFRTRSGREMTYPGKGNPDIIAAAGPVDPDVGVLSAWKPDGSLLGCVVNFGCHATTMIGGAISADWPYYMEQTVRGVMGAGAPVLLLNGPCGDVSQVDELSMREQETGEKWARRVGQRVGAEVLKVLAEAEPADLQPVDTARETVQIPTRAVPPDRLQRALALVKSDAAHDHEWCFARDQVLLHETNKVEPQVQCEVQAIQVGPLVVVCNPAELFCQIGLDIKAGSTFPYTFVVELANGCVGYVPTESAMGPSGGGYETRAAMSSKLVPQAAGLIAHASLNVIRLLNPGRAPEPPHVARETPWVMGTAGPEAV